MNATERPPTSPTTGEAEGLPYGVSTSRLPKTPGTSRTRTPRRRRSPPCSGGLLLGSSRRGLLAGRLRAVLRLAALRVGLRLGRRPRLRLGRRGLGLGAAVGGVEARSLEHDPGRMEHLPERPSTDPAGREGGLADPLEHLDVLSAFRAGVLVGGHRASILSERGIHPA